MHSKGRMIIGVLFIIMACYGSQASAATDDEMKKNLKLADDITKETIVGPGSVQEPG